MILKVLLIFIFCCYFTNCKNVQLQTDNGYINGYVSYEAGPDKPVNGVPFAKPPIGDLRFRKLEEIDSWFGIVDATKYGPACMSNTSRTHSPQRYISDDCIYLNIFADAKSIMFNETAIIKNYASDGIIFVITAYRLGLFGFLDFGNDEVVPRNLGLHDIVFGLKWLNKEAANFGGDNNQITIMGNSAGAVLIEYVVVSPAVPKSLFKQAIVTSASPHYKPDMNLYPTLKILEKFNCLKDTEGKTIHSDYDRVECLRNYSSHDLLSTQRDLEGSAIYFRGPTQDTELLPEKFYINMLKYWKPINLLITGTPRERMIFEQGFEFECQENLNTFGYETNEVFNACMERYADNPLPVTSEPNHAEIFASALSNTLNGGKTYLGIFSLKGHDIHAMDLLYFFGSYYSTFTYKPEDYLMQAYYPEMIKNFLHGNRPDKHWEPVSQNGSNHFFLEFSVENNKIVQVPHLSNGIYDREGIKFWLSDAFLIEQKAKKSAGKSRMDETSGIKSLYSLAMQNGSQKANKPLIRLTNQNYTFLWLITTGIMIVFVVILVVLLSKLLYNYKNAGNMQLTEKTCIVDKDEDYYKYT